MIEPLIYWAISLLFVIALILGLALLIKKFALPHSTGNPLFRKNKHRRLQIIDTLPLDHKSRLMLVRRDDKEHLLLIGHETNLLIETGIPHLADQTKSSKATLSTRSRSDTGGAHKDIASVEPIDSSTETDGGK